jgi:hypothetical protein
MKEASGQWSVVSGQWSVVSGRWLGSVARAVRAVTSDEQAKTASRLCESRRAGQHHAKGARIGGKTIKRFRAIGGLTNVG